jgi:hypothetical protein
MIIRRKNSSIKENTTIIHPYEPIDDWSKSDISISGIESEYYNYFKEVFSKLNRIDAQVIIENEIDSIKIMKSIKNKIQNLNVIPQIVVKIPHRIKPSVVLLKYFTIISYDN